MTRSLKCQNLRQRPYKISKVTTPRQQLIKLSLKKAPAHLLTSPYLKHLSQHPPLTRTTPLQRSWLQPSPQPSKRPSHSNLQVITNVRWSNNNNFCQSKPFQSWVRLPRKQTHLPLSNKTRLSASTTLARIALNRRRRRMIAWSLAI